jgi:amidase
MAKTDLTTFSSAGQMLDAMRAGEVSAVELLDLHLERIERLDVPINAMIVRTFEQARMDAARADAARSDGAQRPLLGLPITIKESIDIAGLATTAGVPARARHRAERDATTVARLRNAGAIVIGKTNVCPWLADLIAENPVYGRTNNPWDLSRTPGGSSGGSAALAAGFSALDLGSDLGGSIRIPASFCGLCGHKPSEGAVPNSGHFPGSSLPNAGSLMAAQGPLTRSAFDLELALNVLAGPDVGMDAAWRLQFPAARHGRLADFRIAVLPSLDWLPVDPETVSAITSFADVLRKEGATVVEQLPSGLGDLREFYRQSRIMMSALVSAHWPAEQRERVIQDRDSRGEFSHSADVLGFRATASDFLKAHEQREHYRAGYRDFFRDVDVLLTPMSLVPAFPHPVLPVCDRELEIAGESIGFDYMTFYPSLASLPGHGATAFPLGLSSSGLPLGAQAIGPFLEDLTPIRFAQLAERILGGFKPPPSPVG